MKYVEPIRDRKKIAHIKNLLRGQRRYRDLLRFVVGINSALRISDLLKLQSGHFMDEKGRIKSRFWIKEQKRGKRHEIAVNQSIRDALTEYLGEFPYVAKEGENFLFFNPKTNQPIKRRQAWMFITAICREVGLRGNYGTHVLKVIGEMHCFAAFQDFFRRIIEFYIFAVLVCGEELYLDSAIVSLTPISMA